MHSYQYANINPLLLRDPSGRTTLGEVNIVQQIQSISASIARNSLVRYVNTARNFVDIITAVNDVLSLVEGAFSGPAFDKYLSDAQSPFKNLDVTKATMALMTQMPQILRYALPEWTTYLAPKSTSQLKAFLLYLPNPAILPEIEIPAPGQMAVGHTPVKFIAGGTSNFGRLVGLGVKLTGTPTSGRLQIWRMDYHGWHHNVTPIQDKSDVRAWEDGGFHFHVRRRPSI
jgi:hypothetical protein